LEENLIDSNLPGITMKQPKLLVAGANGLNGRLLLKKLAENNIPARAMVRNKDRAKDLENKTTEIVEADLSNPATLDKAFDSIERAFIVTAIHPDAATYFSNFFQAAKKTGIKHVIKLSGLGASADSPSEILRQHYQSDAQLVQSGLDFTVVQPNSFFQNIFGQAKAIQRKGRFGMLLGDASQSLVDMNDVAEATVRIIQDKSHRNKIYPLTGPESISGNDMAEQLAAFLEKPIRYKPISGTLAKQEMLAGGLPEWNANALVEIMELFATGAFQETTCDLESILDRKPNRLADFLTENTSMFV